MLDLVYSVRKISLAFAFSAAYTEARHNIQGTDEPSRVLCDIDGESVKKLVGQRLSVYLLFPLFLGPPKGQKLL